MLRVEGKVEWPDAFAKTYAMGIAGDLEALEAGVEEVAVALSPDFKSAFNTARKRDASVELSDLLREILEDPQDRLIQQLCRDNGRDPRGTASDVVDDWRERAKRLSSWTRTAVGRRRGSLLIA